MKKIIIKTKIAKKDKLHKKIRTKVFGSNERPRLAIYKSNRFIYAQIINDETHKSLVSASDIKTYLNSKVNKIESAKKVGAEIANLAKNLKIQKVVFDRGGFSFKGRVKALADSARENGLEF